MSAWWTAKMFAAGTGQMSSVDGVHMPAAATGQISAAVLLSQDRNDVCFRNKIDAK